MFIVHLCNGCSSLRSVADFGSADALGACMATEHIRRASELWHCRLQR
jgi:hypothetical protein